MKLRIKGNSIRYRLSRSEVGKLAKTGYLEEQTLFGENKFVYALQSVDKGNELIASFDQNKITLFVPSTMVKGWPENDVVGFHTNMPLTGNNSLYILLEKDFICLDETTEDQTDNYENPHKTC
ncbi:MAG: hypothetical protein ABI741_06955 [Ferruginibacter sp.]